MPLPSRHLPSAQRAEASNREVTQAKPKQELILINISVILCFLLSLQASLPHRTWRHLGFSEQFCKVWTLTVLRFRQGTPLATDHYLPGTSLNLSLAFTEQHLCCASTSALKIVTVLSVNEKAWLSTPAFSAQTMEASPCI